MPVRALRVYLDVTSEGTADRLFLWPRSLRPFSRLHVSTLLRDVIEEADPGRAPAARDIRKLSATMAYMRSYDLEAVRDAGQWSSDLSFVSRYLSHDVPVLPAVVLSGPPAST